MDPADRYLLHVRGRSNELPGGPGLLPIGQRLTAVHPRRFDAVVAVPGAAITLPPFNGEGLGAGSELYRSLYVVHLPQRRSRRLQRAACVFV